MSQPAMRVFSTEFKEGVVLRLEAGDCGDTYSIAELPAGPIASSPSSACGVPPLCSGPCGATAPTRRGVWPAAVFDAKWPASVVEKAGKTDRRSTRRGRIGRSRKRRTRSPGVAAASRPGRVRSGSSRLRERSYRGIQKLSHKRNPRAGRSEEPLDRAYSLSQDPYRDPPA